MTLRACRHFAFVCILPVFLGTLIACTTIATTTYNLQTPLLAEHGRITIVLVSDLHGTIHGKDQTILINLIKNNNPDIIILSGDIFDDIVSMTGTRMLLAGISAIAPVYYVTGNHEYMSPDIQAIRSELAAFGVIILPDTYTKARINSHEIIVAGIDDPYKKRYEMADYNQQNSMEKAFRELDTIPLYKILIAHRPELIEQYKKYSFNLILSGHAHGGQVRLPPVLNGLYASGQGLFPKYAGGMYIHENTTHIVSRGLSIDPWIPRIGNPPELVVIRLVR